VVFFYYCSDYNFLFFFLSSADEGMQSVTMWVVCDLESKEGRELLYSAMKHLVRRLN